MINTPDSTVDAFIEAYKTRTGANKMTTIKARFTGDSYDLAALYWEGIRYASQYRFTEGCLTVWFVVETDDYDAALGQAMDCMDIGAADRLNCECMGVA